MAGKFALIIGNSEYTDPNLTRLKAPEADVNALSALLRNPEIGAFDEVITLANEFSANIRRTIARFFAQKTADDLLLLYFSGHGVLDDRGELFFAAKDTERDLIRGTAIPAKYVTDEMDGSRSRRQVLILDCCHSGAFARGSKGVVGASVGTASAFQGTGYGRVVLTATDATQFAWEGDQVIGNAENSLFTHYLIEGLQTGEADTDADGRITLDNLYDYVYGQVVKTTPKQTPGKWSYKQQGEIVIAANPKPIIKPAELPREIRDAIESPLAGVREGTIRELERLLNGRHPGLALAALDVLKQLAEDDSRRVASVAIGIVSAYEEAQRAKEQAREQLEQERIARERIEIERVQREKAEQEIIAREKTEAERVEREKAKAEQLERENVERARIAEEKAKAERLTREKAAQEQIAREKTEAAERVAREKTEAARVEKEKAEVERRARERVEQERRARAKEEQDQLTKEKAQVVSPTLPSKAIVQALPTSASRNMKPLLIGGGIVGTIVVVCIVLVAVFLGSVAQPTASPAVSDSIGVVTIRPNDPIHVAWMLVVTGADGTLGVDERRGIEIAIDDKGGKLLGHTIKLDGQDSGCSAETGQAAATKLATDTTIVAVIGSSCSSEMRAGGPTLSKAGFTMVSPSNTYPDLTDPATRIAGYFRTSHNDKVQSVVAAQFALTQLKVKTAATIDDGSAYAKSLASAFGENFEKGGGKITSKETVSPTDKDFKLVLTKIAAGKPEILFYPILNGAAPYLITTQSKQVPGLEKTVLMSSDGTFVSDFYKSAGSAAIGMYQSSPDFSAFTSGYNDFLSKHQKKYNEKPLSAFHAHAYDAANVLFAAIEKVAVKGSDGSLVIGRQALRDAVAATKDFKGITGTLTCDKNGDCGAPVIAIYQTTDDNVTKGQLPDKPIWSPLK